MAEARKPPSESPRDEALSLEKLVQAFAQMVEPPSSEAPAPPADAETPRDEATPADDAAPADEPPDASEISPRTILEAMLFVGNPDSTPVPAARLSSLMRGVEPDELDDLVRALNDRYTAQGCPYTIVSENDGFRLSLRREFHGVREKFHGRVRQARLSQAAVEVLALVAYNGPLSSDQVSHMRGKPSGAILSQLVRRRLLRVDRPEQKPRTAHYSTTQRFLELFGLESLADLPRSQDLDTH